MGTTDTGMIADKWLIKKRNMDDIVCALETADRSQLLEKVIEDVGSGYYLTHFHDRQQQWNAIVTTFKDCLLELRAL